MSKRGFMPAEVFSAHSANYRKIAFTLAEVLITLGIIGVVAALTIPTLIQNHRRKVVETKLKGAYSILNQAVKLSQVQNGEAIYWELPDAWNVEGTEKFLKTYITPYITSELSRNNYHLSYNTIKLNNGIYTYWAYSGEQQGYFEIYTRFNHNNHFTDGTGGKDYFIFAFYPSVGRVEPFYYNIISNPKCTTSSDCCISSIEGYHAFCTELIRRNGWQIPKDYPFRF